jgi:L-methionine (R)-S-oxide reductase
MRQDSDLLAKLTALLQFLEQVDSIDVNLDQLAAMVADAVNAENCFITLFKKEETTSELKLRGSGHHGRLPDAQWQEAVQIGQDIVGYATANDQALQDIDTLRFAGRAGLPAGPSRGFISAPIPVGNKIAGIIKIDARKDGRPLRPPDLDRLILVCLFVGRSLQVIHLQNLLNSRYAQFALAQEGHRETATLKDLVGQEPIKLAKILAKTFYREMTKAGLGSDHIISAATEIIAQLSNNLDKHRNRLSPGLSGNGKEVVF